MLFKPDNHAGVMVNKCLRKGATTQRFRGVRDSGSANLEHKRATRQKYGENPSSFLRGTIENRVH
jgi:hypothetical protein